MGHYSHTCKLTGLPITGGTPVVLFPMVLSDRLYENSEKKLKEQGSTYMCTNDGNRLKFNPCYLPIKGTYNDYGGIEDIIRDESTKILESYFGISVEDICQVLTRGGWDGIECDIPEGFEDRIEDELKKVSGMWIHRTVYENLTAKKEKVDEYEGLDLGTPELLEALGFTEINESINLAIHDPKRYKRTFQKGELIVNSDGTWISVPNEQIYRISDFAKYCEKMGEPIENLGSHLNKTYIEQLCDYVIPKHNKFHQRPNNKKKLEVSKEEIAEYQKNWKSLFKIELTDEEALESILEDKTDNLFKGKDRMSQRIGYKLLNFDEYKIKNPITFDYYDTLKEGNEDLKNSFREFWEFDKYLFATGTFYDVVGTSPQDGEIDLVKEVIDTAKIIADERYEYYHEDDDYEEDEEEDSESTSETTSEDLDIDEDIRI